MLVQILVETPTALFSFPIPFRQVLGQYLKLGHDQFFTHPFPFSIHQSSYLSLLYRM